MPGQLEVDVPPEGCFEDVESADSRLAIVNNNDDVVSGNNSPTITPGSWKICEEVHAVNNQEDYSEDHMHLKNNESYGSKNERYILLLLRIYIQGIHKRMVPFQKLTRNLFLTLRGHNVHRQQRQLSKFLMRYQQFASHAC